MSELKELDGKETEEKKKEIRRLTRQITALDVKYEFGMMPMSKEDAERHKTLKEQRAGLQKELSNGKSFAVAAGAPFGAKGGVKTGQTKAEREQIDIAAIGSKLKELETIKDQTGDPDKFVNMVYRNVENIQTASAQKPKGVSTQEDLHRITWPNVLDAGVNPKVELALSGSKQRREEAMKEFWENPNIFIEIIRKNAKKLMENWELIPEREFDGKKEPAVRLFNDSRSASLVVIDIALERGLAQTERIVDEMIEIHKKALKDNYRAYSDNSLQKVLKGKIPPSPKLDFNVDETIPETKIAYSIAGLYEGGLHLDLAAQIGSVNPKVGLEMYKTLINKVIKTGMKELQEARSVVNRTGAEGPRPDVQTPDWLQ